MKFDFFKTRVAIVIIGLILGLFIGFKIANSQYRREKESVLSGAVAKASGGATSNTSSDQALNEARRAIDKAKNNPQDAEAQLDAADQFIQISRPEEALQFLEQANQVKPNDARTMAGFGMANFMMSKYDEAIKWSKKSIELEPNNPGASFLLIASYIRSNKNLDEAEKLINKLEAEGVDQTMLAKVREELNLARSGQSGRSEGASGSKTVLDHGPKDEAPSRDSKKPGGRP